MGAREQRIILGSSRVWLLGFLAALGALCSVSDGLAATTTFAQFKQGASGTPNPFQYTNGSTDGTNAFAVTSQPVIFQFDVANGYGASIGQTIAAHLSLTATAQGTAVPVGHQLTQQLSSIELTITADAPVSGHNVLLKVDVDNTLTSTGSFTGRNGGVVGLFGSDTGSSGHFSYSSDFLSFIGSTSENYAFSLSSLSPGLTQNISNSYLNTFSAAGTGSFAAGSVSQPTPEPQSVVLMLLGALGWVAIRWNLGRRAA